MTVTHSEPIHDPGRLAALRKVALLDTPAEDAFDRLTRLATRVLGAPVALVSLVDEDRQFFKSCVGLPEPWASTRETPLSHSFCQHAVASGEPLVIEDARGHPLVRDNLAVPELGVVAYAGIPLITSDGHALGSFCVIDSKPRAWTEEEIEILADLAASVATEIELRLEVAERKRAEEEQAGLLARVLGAEARFRALFDNAADAILVADAEGRYLAANPAATELLGYGREELLGLRVADVVAAGGVWAAAEYERYVREGRWRGELELRRRDGSLVPVEARATVVALPTGPVYMSSVRDITERRAQERMQRDFIAMVVHELRTPVTSIKGFAQIMQRRGFDEQAVTTIAADAGRLQRLIGDLMSATSLDAERLQLERTAVDITELVRTLADEAQALTRRHLIRVDAPDGRLEGWWDRGRLEQVIRNLLANAVKYSPDGGEILLRVEDLGEQARVSVSDQGIGLPPGEPSRLFDRFFRAEAGKAAAQGLGLGLYVSRLLIEAHGGQIWAESAGEGQGSTFAFSLPNQHPEGP